MKMGLGRRSQVRSPAVPGAALSRRVRAHGAVQDIAGVTSREGAVVETGVCLESVQRTVGRALPESALESVLGRSCAGSNPQCG